MTNEEKVAVIVLEKERTELLKEADKLQEEAELINHLIKRITKRSDTLISTPVLKYEGAIKSEYLDDRPDRSVNRTSDFPKNNKEQLLYLLNYINRPARMPELQQLYNEISGNSRIIRFDLIALRNEGVVKAIIFNKNSQLMYYGLASWVVQGEYGKTFRTELFSPDKGKFPKGIWESQIVEDANPIGSSTVDEKQKAMDTHSLKDNALAAHR